MFRNYNALVIRSFYGVSSDMVSDAEASRWPSASSIKTILYRGARRVDGLRLFKPKYAGLLFLMFFMFSNKILALDLELTQGINATLPIAMNAFRGGEVANQVSDVIKHDLHLSGQFKILSLPIAEGEKAPISLLRRVGADGYLSGQVTPLGGGRYNVSFELMDTIGHGRVLLHQDFPVNQQELRALSHHISDLVYEKLTGERGVFSTQIAYIVVKRSPSRTQHLLEVADVDGYNPRILLQSSEPIMSPSWSPNGKEIAYVSFEKKKAQIFTVSVETGKRRLVTDFSGINGAPTWSPDGRQLALALSKSGSLKIYTVDLNTGAMKQLTFGESIDTEPRYSPDGQSLLFTSGRGGNPQIYRLRLSDGAINRLTFEGNYNARASYTPDQKHIVMHHREDRNFNIATQDEHGNLNQITFSGFDESPSVSPNGRLVLFATRYQNKGVLGIVSLDGHINLRLPSRDGDVQEPAWSPFL